MSLRSGGGLLLLKPDGIIFDANKEKEKPKNNREVEASADETL